MSCQRCNGLCVRGYLVERGQEVPVVKCVNCGEMIDSNIILNRISQIGKNQQERGSLLVKKGFSERPFRTSLGYQ